MGVWKIYHKDGTIVKDANGNEIDIRSLEYLDSWMGECYLTVTFKHETPIVFSMGDYIIYRNEKFVLNYEPGKDKKARINTCGDGFVYSSVKFNSLQNELSDAEFLDVVLNDNELHYTALPKFQFYVETLDDLLDRIQANLNEQIGAGEWKIFSRNKDRSEQRGCTADEWNAAYGEGTGDNVIDSMSITADSLTCWDALALVNSKWNVNFIVRGRNVYVGTAGVTIGHMFEYGRDNGLYEIEQNADSEQKVITRLRAYGSEKNLPSHYYADLGVKYVANITKVVGASTNVELELDTDYIETYFKNKRKYVVSGESQEQENGWVLKVTFDFQTIITGYVTQLSDSNKCRFYSELKGTQTDSGYEESKEKLDAFIAQANTGNTKMYITSGLNKNSVPSSMKEYAENLPNNMSISRLMLPGFPSMSLNDYYNSLSKEDKAYVNPKGKQYIFSTDKYRPYVDSANISKIGLHSSSQFFDTDDKTNGIIEIYPTLEEMVIGGVRVDEINEGVAPADNGRFEDGQNVANVDIYLSPNIDFDITGLKHSDFSISMKDGMCGGRTFTVATTNKVGNRWRLTIERVKDSALDLWFPYQDYPIKAGDHFVLTGITLPDSYVKAASLKLLKYTLALLDKNDYTRYVYQPKVDELFMARQHDAAMSDKTGAIKSLHDTLKAGDLMDFRDDDLNIKGTITIDQLNIKEQDGKIPTYEITLREDKEVGTIQKIQQQITSLESGNGGSGGGGGITLAQVKGQVASEGSKVFLSKLTDDIAQGKITFMKGLIAKGLADLMMGAKFGNNAKITELGEAVFNAIKSLDYDNAAEQGFSVEKEKNGKYHAFITNLTIWGKAIFHEIEVRKLSYSGGNIYLSGAGSKLIKVVPVKKSVSADGVTSWAEMTEDDAECVGWKCYLLADDGTTATMNYWQEGDQVRCQTMGEIASGGTYNDVSNKSYWRTIPNDGVSTQNEKIYGTKTETYLDEDGNEQTREVQVELYDGQAFAWIVIGKHCSDIDGYDDEFSVGYNGSKPAPLETRDIPSAGDTIVLDGNRHRNDQQEYDKTDRQNVIVLETTGEYAPRIACFANITEYKHTITKNVNGEKKEVSLSVFETSPKGGTKINSSRFEWISDDGSTINIINYRGDWMDGNTYHKNDQVNHNNAVWVCVANSGVDVTDEPLDGSGNWKKVLVGGKGEKGDKGDDGLSGNGIVPAYIRSEGTPMPPTSTDKNNLDNGWLLTIPSVGDVENVSYGDSSWTDYSDNNGYTWKKSPTTAANSTSPCLVTFTTTKANQAVKFVIKSFSEEKYDYIFLSEIDASVVPSKPGYSGSSRAVSGNGVELSVTDIVATAGTHTVYICYGKDSSNDYYGDYGLFRIENIAVRPLWQSNGKEVFTRDDSGVMKSEIESWSEPFRVTGEDGTDGKDGTPGEDAYRVEVSPSVLIFDTDDNGRVTSLSGKTATIRVYQGDKDVSSQFSKYDRFPSNYYNCNGSLKGLNKFPLEIQVTNIESQVVTDTAGNESTISKTNGFLEFILEKGSATVTAHVDVQVNVAMFTGQMVNTNKRFSNTLGEVSTSVDNKLTQFKGEITQTAREISLSVSEKIIGRRNLLVGSAFQRDDSNRTINYAASIEINSGYQGTNCVKCIDDTKKGDPHYIGVFWDGSQGGKSIKITKGKKYVLSCYCKTNDINAIFCLEALYTDKQTNAQRKGAPEYLTNSSFRCERANRWELFTAVIDTTDAEYDYIAFNFFEHSNGDYGRIEAWICRTMVEEGDTYNGWTLSTEDYDYVGGNMLDNTRTLDKSGTLYEVNGTLTPVGFGESTSIYKSFVYKLKGTVDSFSQLPSYGNTYGDTYCVRNTEICYRYNGSEFESVGNDYYYNVLEWRKLESGGFVPFGLEANKDYVFSFMAKGTGKLTAYFYNPVTNVFVETSLGDTATREDGAANFQLTSDWKKYWVHWRPSDSLHKYVLLRLNRTIQSSVGDAPITDCYIAQPKLETGAVVTEYTERKSDLVDKASLKAAGIVVDSESVTLYGSQVHIKKNKNDTNDTVLIDNNTGKVSAGLINAEKVVAEGIATQNLEAKNLKVTGNSKFGIWEITKDDTFGEMIRARGDLTLPSGESVAGSGIGYLPLYIRGGNADAASYFRVGVTCTEFSYPYNGINDFCGIWVGKAADYVCGGVENTNLNTPYVYGYSTSYHPAAYIYAKKSSPNDPAFAINVQSKGTIGERTAIQTNAAIRGVFAPNSMSANYSQTIPSGIGVVICTNGSDMTLTLPANPLEGQTLIIIQGSTSRVNIIPYGYEKIYCKGETNDKNNKFYSGKIGQFNIFVYVRGAWQLQWMN